MDQKLYLQEILKQMTVFSQKTVYFLSPWSIFFFSCSNLQVLLLVQDVIEHGLKSSPDLLTRGLDQHRGEDKAETVVPQLRGVGQDGALGLVPIIRGSSSRV